MKQIYKITYPTGKIYIGQDRYGSFRYVGSPSILVVNADFEKNLPREQHHDYTIRKQILWESETATAAELTAKEIEMINAHRSNDPKIGYNQWPPRKQNGQCAEVVTSDDTVIPLETGDSSGVEIRHCPHCGHQLAERPLVDVDDC